MLKKIHSTEKILIFIVWFFTRRNKKVLYSEYDGFINRLNNVSDEQQTADKNLNINHNTINSILNKLDKFENSKKYLKRDVNLTSLASHFDTNPRYLSEIIKQYKRKSYNNYINSLRVNHIIEKLHKDTIYREYKITYLAEYCGFASREVFASAFKKEIGVTPSHFINEFRMMENKV